MKFNIIYVDPPWKYNSRSNPKTKFGKGTPYPTLTADELKQLPVSLLAEENCALFMWVTFPRLQEGLDLMKAWGFDYKTLAFGWVKTNKDGSPFFGIGYYTKSNIELCLLGVKGKMKPIDNSISNTLLTIREEHSRKPEVVRDKIVQLFGDLPRIELFARQTADGWWSAGNEIDGADISESIRTILTIEQ